MDSGFYNSIYLIVSHVVTTIHYYTFKIALSMTHKNLFNTSTIELPWMTSSWRILSNSIHCFLRRLGTDHPQKTHHLLSSGYHVLLSGVSTHALSSNGRPILAHLLLWYVSTGLLHSHGRPSIVGCSLVGTCLPIRLLETAQSVTILIWNEAGLALCLRTICAHFSIPLDSNSAKRIQCSLEDVVTHPVQGA
jgi:hypothetical protein